MSQTGTLGEITGKRLALLSALLEGLSTEQAAKRAGVGERTAYRYVKEQAFKDALASGRQALFLEHLSALRTGIKDAIATLSRNMGPTIPPATQVASARAWLDNAIALYKVDEEQPTTVNVHLDPEWLTLRARLITVLADYPDARTAVVSALSEAGGSNGHVR